MKFGVHNISHYLGD